MFAGDKTAESKQFEDAIIAFFKMQNVKIIKAEYNDRTQLSGVYSFDEAKKIKKNWSSLDSFLSNIADNISFEIAERYQRSDSATLVNESGFKLSATLAEA